MGVYSNYIKLSEDTLDLKEDDNQEDDIEIDTTDDTKSEENPDDSKESEDTSKEDDTEADTDNTEEDQKDDSKEEDQTEDDTSNEDNDDFSINMDDDSEEDNSSEDSSESDKTDDSVDETPDGDGDNTEEDTKNKMYNSLTPEEKTNMNYILKNNFKDLYMICDDIINKLNGIPKESNNITILKRLMTSCGDLKSYIEFYITKVYPTKTYLENDIAFNKYLQILNGIKFTFRELEKIMVDEDEISTK